ncbi:MAG: hypothetical protein A4E50_01595 [Methanosaeta sp. PtaB.Bin087]|nr:MAG: hypothetical protein A4E50_01595 [Methanosaeta sp. PtaB.Bin087]OPY52415.1 MAG: hypothetical protein A4E51_01323 [Methanosaeta sp. PtaU1.Bin055]
MKKETLTAVTASRRAFAIPKDLLNYFEDEVRFIPHINHPDGYIMFDKKMLISILRSDDTKMRYGLAKTLEKFDEAGGELVIMQQPSIQ